MDVMSRHQINLLIQCFVFNIVGLAQNGSTANSRIEARLLFLIFGLSEFLLNKKSFFETVIYSWPILAQKIQTTGREVFGPKIIY